MPSNIILRLAAVKRDGSRPDGGDGRWAREGRLLRLVVVFRLNLLLLLLDNRAAFVRQTRPDPRHLQQRCPLLCPLHDERVGGLDVPQVLAELEWLGRRERGSATLARENPAKWGPGGIVRPRKRLGARSLTIRRASFFARAASPRRLCSVVT